MVHNAVAQLLQQQVQTNTDDIPTQNAMLHLSRVLDQQLGFPVQPMTSLEAQNQDAYRAIVQRLRLQERDSYAELNEMGAQVTLERQQPSRMQQNRKEYSIPQLSQLGILPRFLDSSAKSSNFKQSP